MLKILMDALMEIFSFFGYIKNVVFSISGQKCCSITFQCPIVHYSFFSFFFFFSPCALSMQILRRSYTHSAHMGCACAEILDLPHEVIVRGVRRRVAVLAQWMLLNTRANWSAWEILSKI